MGDAKAYQAGDRFVRVAQTQGSVTFTIYDDRAELRVHAGRRIMRETVSPAPGVRPELDVLWDAPDGAIGIVRPGQGVIASAAVPAMGMAS